MIKAFGEIVLSPLTTVQLQCIPKHQNSYVQRYIFVKCNKIQIFLFGSPSPFSAIHLIDVQSVSYKSTSHIVAQFFHITGDLPHLKSIIQILCCKWIFIMVRAVLILIENIHLAERSSKKLVKTVTFSAHHFAAITSRSDKILFMSSKYGQLFLLFFPSFWCNTTAFLECLMLVSPKFHNFWHNLPRG